MPTANRCCSTCCGLIFSAGLMVFIMWIVLITAHNPKLSLLDLNLPITDTNNTTMTFKLKLDNTNLAIGIYYSNLTTSFHYPSNKSSAFSDIVIPAFYQGHRKKAVKIGTGEISRNVNWTENFGTAANGTTGVVQVGVHVDGTIRFKYEGWRDRKHRVSVQGVVGVDRQGKFSNDKGLRLKSDASKRLLDMSFGVVLLVVVFSNFGFTSFF